MKGYLRFSCCFLLFFLSFNLLSAQSNDENLYLTLEQKRIAVEKDPENTELHQAYLSSVSKKDSLAVNQQYAKWMQRFPKSAVIPFALVKFYYVHADPRARAYLLKAVANKPDFAEGWNRLSIDALFWGDNEQAKEYLEKAATSDRANADYAYSYLYSFKHTEKQKFDSLALDLVLRFPGHNRAAMALEELADTEQNPVVKIAYFEQLYQRFSETQPEGFKMGMNGYFNYLLSADAPDKAYALALKMVLDRQKRNGLEWKFKIKTARQYMALKDLMGAQKYEEALTVLEKIKTVDHFSASSAGSALKLFFLKAELRDLTGKTQMAYDSLAVYYSKLPSDQLRKTMLGYGVKLGLDSNQVGQHIQTLLEKKMVHAKDFTLIEYGTLKKVSLSNYKGKVVLLTYWFPGCGPCRREFPHFENVIRKYGKDQVIYLGINGYPEQDGFVIPFMKATGYSFTSLKEDINRDRGNLIAFGYPANYLIDQQGRIVYSKFFIEESDEPGLELMINGLLNAKTK